MVLFWMTSVFALELGVHAPLGVVLPDEELPQPMASAIPPAIAIAPTHSLSLCIASSCRAGPGPPLGGSKGPRLPL